MGTALLALCFCAMSLVLAFAICDKQAHNKGIRTKTSINTKSVQLIELHAFCLLFIMHFLFGTYFTSSNISFIDYQSFIVFRLLLERNLQLANRGKDKQK